VVLPPAPLGHDGRRRREAASTRREHQEACLRGEEWAGVVMPRTMLWPFLHQSWCHPTHTCSLPFFIYL